MNRLMSGVHPQSGTVRHKQSADCVQDRRLHVYSDEPQCQKKVPSDICAQRRFRPDLAIAQSDQNLHWTQFG